MTALDLRRIALAAATAIAVAAPCSGHGTVVYPMSRVYRIYQSNPSNPNFQLARNAVALDGTLSYYTWNEVSRNVPEAVRAGLPPGFDYSPWMPDGQIGSAGRVDPRSPSYPRTYLGLDQVSSEWPTTPLVAGDTITVSFLVTAPHSPSVWDVWMTTPGWNPSSPLTWGEMEFLGRPTVTLSGSYYTFSLTIPANRSGHHVLWVAWQRNDPAGEAFFSTSDVMIGPRATYAGYGSGCPGSNNTIPTLTNLTAPVLGQDLDLEIDGVASGASVSLLFGRSTMLDLGAVSPGCTLLSTADVVFPLGVWPGQKVGVTVPIPPITSYLGAQFSNQVAVLDRGPPLAMSAGRLATIGWP